MRVLHVSATDGLGGAGVALLRLHEALLSQGVESRVLLAWNERSVPGSARWRQPERLRSRLQRLGQRIGLNYVVLPFGFGLPLRKDYRWADVVHFHNLHGGYFNYLALPAVTRFRPSLMTLHDIWPFTGHCGYSFDCRRWETGCGSCPYLDTYPAIETDRTRVEWELKAWAFGRSRLEIVCPTRALQREAGKSLLKGLPRRVIPHGVDTAVFRPGDRHARRSLGIREDAFVVMLGAFDLRSAHKGADVAIAALRSLPPALSARVHVVALGHGGEEVCAKMGLPHIAPGFVPDDARKRELYTAADVLLYPTRADIFGLVPLEAIACGTPVIASRLSGVDEVVVDGVSGRLCPVGDAAAFGRALADLAGDPTLHAMLARSAAEHARRHFSLEAHVAAYRQCYGELAERSRRRRAA
jgi:glycosyltransferase involved in cell wall biosynthesis